MDMNTFPTPEALDFAKYEDAVWFNRQVFIHNVRRPQSFEKSLCMILRIYFLRKWSSRFVLEVIEICRPGA